MNDILRISVPLTVWLAAFSAIYGLQGIICSDRWTEAGLDLAAGRVALVVAWIAVIALQFAFLLALRSPRYGSRHTFVRGVSLILAVAAIVTTVWTLLPIVTTSVCL